VGDEEEDDAQKHEDEVEEEQPAERLADLLLSRVFGHAEEGEELASDVEDAHELGDEVEDSLDDTLLGHGECEVEGVDDLGGESEEELEEREVAEGGGRGRR